MSETTKKSAYQEEIDRHVEAAKLAAESLSMISRIPPDIEGITSLYVSPNYVAVDTEPWAFTSVVASMLKVFDYKTAKKRFNQYTGGVEASFYNGVVSVHVKSTPTRCEVERYEEVVNTPAKTETVTRFRLKNPEECLGSANADA